MLSDEQLDARVLDAVPLVTRVAAVVRAAGPERVVESMDRLIGRCRQDLRDSTGMPRRWVQRKQRQLTQLQELRVEVFSGAIPRPVNPPPPGKPANRAPVVSRQAAVAVVWVPDVPRPAPKVQRPRQP